MFLNLRRIKFCDPSNVKGGKVFTPCPLTFNCLFRHLQEFHHLLPILSRQKNRPSDSPMIPLLVTYSPLYLSELIVETLPFPTLTAIVLPCPYRSIVEDIQQSSYMLVDTTPAISPAWIKLVVFSF